MIRFSFRGSGRKSKKMYLSKDILSHIQLKRLSDHKYSACGHTLLDPIIQPFWNWVVLKLPLWLAPNLMTISGLLVNILTAVLVMCYTPDAKQEAPRWTFALCAVGLFIYQTLDGCDGKQARRTGTSSPLGELFDHGCDSLSTVFVALSVCGAIQLGTYPSWMFFQSFMAMSLFYVAHWQVYVTGTLRFGRFDVTETQYVVMIMQLVSAIFGPKIWSITIPKLSIQIKLLPIFSAILAGSFAVYKNFTMIFTRGAGKSGSSVAGTSILSPFMPLALVVVPAFIIYQKSLSHVYENHPCLYILAFGMVACKITNKLVVAHMTKSDIDCLDSILLGPGMLFLNQYFNTYIDEYIVLWLCFVYATANLIHYCTIVCLQICAHMHIDLFSIEPKNVVLDREDYPEASVAQPLLQGFSNDASSETSNTILEIESPSYQHSIREDFDESKLDDEIP